jgi:hypothetical protein
MWGLKYMARANFQTKILPLLLLDNDFVISSFKKWESDVKNSSKGQIYRIYKSHFGCEKIF